MANANIFSQYAQPLRSVADYPNLAAFQARCEGRPAFRRALDAQLVNFTKYAPEAAAA